MKDNFSARSCSALTRQYDVQLFGTAPRVSVWFLLEYPFAFGKNAVANNTVPEAAISMIREQLQVNENARLQLIQREQSQSPEHLTLYIALTDEAEPRLYELHLESYADLENINFAAFIQRSAEVDAHRVDMPLFIICTNAAHDACCAGSKTIYEQFARHETIAAWQSTHLSGHRFAPTLVAFPQGVYYGQVDPDDVEKVITAHVEGHLYLPKMRGRTCYDPAVQAAGYFLREQVNTTAFDALRFLEISESETDGWMVSFQTKLDHHVHRLHIQRTMRDLRLKTGCDKTEAAPVYDYLCVDYQIVT